MVTPLTSALDGRLVNPFDSSEPKWRTFLHDHRAQLLAECRTVDINERDRHEFKHRPLMLLEKLGVPSEAQRIVLWLNDLTEISTILSIETLRILEETETLRTLYTSYQTWISYHDQLAVTSS